MTTAPQPDVEYDRLEAQLTDCFRTIIRMLRQDHTSHKENTRNIKKVEQMCQALLMATHTEMSEMRRQMAELRRGQQDTLEMVGTLRGIVDFLVRRVQFNDMPHEYQPGQMAQAPHTSAAAASRPTQSTPRGPAPHTPHPSPTTAQDLASPLQHDQAAPASASSSISGLEIIGRPYHHLLPAEPQESSESSPAHLAAPLHVETERLPVDPVDVADPAALRSFTPTPSPTSAPQHPRFRLHSPVASGGSSVAPRHEPIVDQGAAAPRAPHTGRSSSTNTNTNTAAPVAAALAPGSTNQGAAAGGRTAATRNAPAPAATVARTNRGPAAGGRTAAPAPRHSAPHTSTAPRRNSTTRRYTSSSRHAPSFLQPTMSSLSKTAYPYPAVLRG